MKPSRLILTATLSLLLCLIVAGCSSHSNPVIPKLQVRSLDQDYPNPFKPDNTITYTVSSNAHVLILVMDVAGMVKATPVDKIQAPGEYAISVADIGLEDGIYFVKITVGSQTTTRRLYVVNP